MKWNILSIGLLTLAGWVASETDASAFFHRIRCCRHHRCNLNISVRPYNAFTPFCYGNLICDGCTPNPCAAACGHVLPGGPVHLWHRGGHFRNKWGHGHGHGYGTGGCAPVGDAGCVSQMMPQAGYFPQMAMQPNYGWTAPVAYYYYPTMPQAAPNQIQNVGYYAPNYGVNPAYNPYAAQMYYWMQMQQAYGMPYGQ